MEELIHLAQEAMLERGLSPHFAQEALQQLEGIRKPAGRSPPCWDLRTLSWCSIDNEGSRDLDQLTFAKEEEGGMVALWVAIANVESLVPKDSPIDAHAQTNTTSVYTPAVVFPMLPHKLSHHLTSFCEGEDRLAVVLRLLFDAAGLLVDASISQALVHNFAKLTYREVGPWLAGTKPVPEKIEKVEGLQRALLLQRALADKLQRQRESAGALSFRTARTRAKVSGKAHVAIWLEEGDAAQQMIENFMIATNSAMARFLLSHGLSIIKRVVRTPKKWERIVAIASELGTYLPEEPDALALSSFLLKQRTHAPETFDDLSLAVLKLLGRGEYVVESPGGIPTGHFGLALQHYIHTTAPNRRYADLIAQRQCVAFLHGSSAPYSLEELDKLASHCTRQEDAANKVERRMNKSAAALLLTSHIGETYEGIITGSAPKGTWVRIYQPPIEGKVIHKHKDIDVGDKVTVRLLAADVKSGFIDFSLVE